MNEKIKVYVKLNSKKVIEEITSEIFIKDTNGYICIDEGSGDKYAHAQGNYFDNGLTDDKGRPNYKFYRNKVVELTEAEKDELFPAPAEELTEIEKLAKRISDLEEAIKELKG